MEIGIGTWIVIGLLAIGLVLAAGIWVFYRVNIAIANHEYDFELRRAYGNHWARMAASEGWIAVGARVTHIYETPEEYAWGRESMDEHEYRLEHEPFTDGYGRIVADYVPKALFLVPEAREA